MNKVAEVQNTVRHNADELQSFLRDLNQWKDEMSKKDQELCNQATSEDSKLPPIRSHKKIEDVETKRKKKDTKPSTEKKSEGPKANRISSFDYDAWEKFDVDKACEQVDEEPIKSPEVSEDSSENEDLEELRRKDQALEEKEKGNEYFRMGKYDQATECYTRGMLCDPSNVFLPANRALALIKQERYAAAEQDCTLALTLDKSYVKALQRRGTARLAQKKYEAAKTDFLEVLRLEPKNMQAKMDLRNVNKLLGVEEEGEAKGKESNKSESKSEVEMVSKSTRSTRVSIEEVGHKRDTGSPLNVEAGSKNDAGCSTRIFIEEVSKTDESTSEKLTDPAIVIPIDKPPHLRSKKPLKRIKISEVAAFEQKQSPASQEQKKVDTVSITSPPSEDVLKTLPVPTTAFQFQADWKQLRHYKKSLYNYLKAIPCEKFPKLFQHSMEVDILSDILNIYNDYYLRDDEDISGGLMALSKVQRFRTLVMLLSPNDQSVLKKLVDIIRVKKTPEEMNVFENLFL